MIGTPHDDLKIQYQKFIVRLEPCKPTQLALSEWIYILSDANSVLLFVRVRVNGICVSFKFNVNAKISSILLL